MASAPQLPLFYKGLEPLSSETHANYKVQPSTVAPFLANQHAIPLTVEEIQKDLDRRRVGQSKVTTPRGERDAVRTRRGGRRTPLRTLLRTSREERRTSRRAGRAAPSASRLAPPS